jgi:peptidoglycan/LPS O-acetylase OafA/YrhL
VIVAIPITAGRSSRGIVNNQNGSIHRVETLDTLRGVAILLVVLMHVSISYRPPGFLSQTITVIGNQGVQLFFLVSAYTMCMTWDARISERKQALKFYIRRLMRIAPLYWTAIVFYRLVQPDMTENVGAEAFVLNALLLHGFWPTAINSVVPGGWSIAVEVTFYLLFPLGPVIA